jgi:E3 ubiquitin-protein ligase SHPRH
VQELVRFSQLQQRDESDLNRYHHALETLIRAEEEADSMIEEVTAALADHTAEGALLMKDGARNMAPAEGINNDKGKQRQVSENPSETSDHEEDSPHTLAGEEHGRGRSGLQNRLRECRLTLHKAKFLQGDIYHILGVSRSEDEAYAAAEKLRHDLLKGERLNPCSLLVGLPDADIFQVRRKMRSVPWHNSHRMRPRST